MIMQKKQSDWNWQWKHLYDNNRWLFTQWIYPNTLNGFRGKSVLDCGCGGGQHLNFVAPYAKEVVGIDLNTPKIARNNARKHKNVRVIEGDIATVSLGRKFDIVYSIGVLHHTNNPTRSFKNIKKMLKNGGRMIIWVYSKEGNYLNRTFLEGIKRIYFLKISKESLALWSRIITALVYLPVYSIYLIPGLKFLPFYEYFRNWRTLSFERNFLNVFDKLNAPTTHFIDKKTIESWFNRREFKDVHVSSYVGVSWRASGTLRSQGGI